MSLPPNAIFVYGTLMQGESHFWLLETAGIIKVDAASIAGELLDMGTYPAVRLATGLSSRVHGQLIELASPNTIWEKVDGYEGPEFRRKIVPVTDGLGLERTAWTYVLALDQGEFRTIPSGRWTSRAAGVSDSATLIP